MLDANNTARLLHERKKLSEQGFVPLNEFSLQHKVPELKKLNVKLKGVPKITDEIIAKLKEFIAKGEGGYGDRMAYGIGTTLVKLTASLLTGNGNITIPYDQANGKTTKVEKQIPVFMSFTEHNGRSTLINAYYDSGNRSVTFALGVPARYRIDVKELPSFEETQLRSAIPPILAHEFAHSVDPEIKQKGFLKNLKLVFKLWGNSAYHQAREIYRKRGYMHGSATTGYFRKSIEYQANVEALAELYKNSKMKKKTVHLMDLLGVYGDAFNDVDIRDSFVQAYYDDMKYRRAIHKELTQRGVKLKPLNVPAGVAA